MLDVNAALAAAAAAAGHSLPDVDEDVVEYCSMALGAFEEDASSLTKDDIESVCMTMQDSIDDAVFQHFVTCVYSQLHSNAAGKSSTTPSSSSAQQPKTDCDASTRLSAAVSMSSAAGSVRGMTSAIASSGVSSTFASPVELAPAIATAAGDGDGLAERAAAAAASSEVGSESGDATNLGTNREQLVLRPDGSTDEIMSMVDWDAGTVLSADIGAQQAFAHVSDAAGNYTEGVLSASWRHTAKGGASGASSDVSIRQLTLANADGELLSGAALNLQDGHKYGLVGRNGTGKTTLLRRIAEGSVPGFPAHLRCVMIELRDYPAEVTPLGAVLMADGYRRRLELLMWALETAAAAAADGAGGDTTLSPHAATTASLEDRSVSRGEAPLAPPDLLQRVAAMPQSQREAVSAALYEEMDAMDAHSAEAEAAKALIAVGLPEERHGAPLHHLSGGWRMRVAIAAAVALQPHVLLADEPSNHLDLEGVWWMGQYLAQLPCTAVVVSHDGSFLDMFATDILHLHQRDLKSYPTDYSGFVQAREDKQAMMNRLQSNLDRKRAHMEASAQRMEAAALGNMKKARASRTTKLARHKGDENKLKQASQRRHRIMFMGLEKTADGKKFSMLSHMRRAGSIADNAGGWKGRKMTAGRVNTDVEEPVHFKFTGPPKAAASASGTAPSLVTCVDAAYTYPGADSPALQHVHLTVDADCRLGIVGPNGAGKTTLLRLLAGMEQPTGGQVTHGPLSRVAYFTQHHTESLDWSMTPLQYMKQQYPGDGEGALRGFLGSFGITGYTPTLQMSKLSGGQRSRVALAALFRGEPHVFIADELTNFFDSLSIDALCAGLNEYTGGVVLVSHNLQLLSSVCTRFAVVEGGSLRMLEGGLEQYLEEHEAAAEL